MLKRLSSNYMKNLVWTLNLTNLEYHIQQMKKYTHLFFFSKIILGWYLCCNDRDYNIQQFVTRKWLLTTQPIKIWQVSNIEIKFRLSIVDLLHELF